MAFKIQGRYLTVTKHVLLTDKNGIETPMKKVSTVAFAEGQKRDVKELLRFANASLASSPLLPLTDD